MGKFRRDNRLLGEFGHDLIRSRRGTSPRQCRKRRRGQAMYPKRALSARFMLEFLHSAPARWVAPIRNIGAARANHDHRWVARKSKLQANDFEAISAIRTMVVFNSGQFHRIVLALRNRGIE